MKTSDLSIKELATFIGVSTDTIRRAVRKGEIPATHVGTALRFDLRHGVAMEVLEQQHDLEQVRALLGHARIDTIQIYTMIRPSRLKQVVSFYEEPARRMLTS